MTENGMLSVDLGGRKERESVGAKEGEREVERGRGAHIITSDLLCTGWVSLTFFNGNDQIIL